jgi:hypothetical protein
VNAGLPRTVRTSANEDTIWEGGGGRERGLPGELLERGLHRELSDKALILMIATGRKTYVKR